MNEVSGKILGLYHRAAAHFHLEEDALFAELPIHPGEDPERFDWDTLCTLSERLERFCGHRATLDQVGELLITVPRMQRTCAAVQLVASPRMLYWAAHMWAGPSAFIHHVNTYDELPDGRVCLGTRIPDGYRDSPQFFQITQGVLRTVPRLLGLPDARVELRLAPREATYFIAPPPSLTLWSRFMRGVKVLVSARAVLGELRDQNDQLRARFDELAAAHDEADRLRLDAERARDVAEGALRVKSEFLAAVSHELRTPLNGIMGLTDMLLDSALSSEQRDHAETILGSANNLVGLINDVLDFSKIEAGRLDLDRVEFDPGAVADGVLRLLLGAARAKGVALLPGPAGALPARVVGDPARVRQVLTNLVGNALKFTERGSVTVGADAAPHTGDRTVLRFTVRDTGIGIAQEAVARIFEPFTQVEATARRRFGGTGLGLAICKQLVAQMGGEIGVETEVGRGSTFWFTVPVEVVAGAARPARTVTVPCPPLVAAPVLVTLDPLPRPASLRPLSLRPTPALPASLRPRSLRPRARSLRPAVAETADATRPCVLLVDDNNLNLKVAAHALRRLDFNVVTATGGARALELFSSRPFDAVLMDCQMPDVDGFEATARIRAFEAAHAWRTPVIALTANAMEGDRERCLAAGMDDYIAKPLKLDVLRDTLTRWLSPVPRTLPSLHQLPAAYS